jgi:hypothetical protein
MPSGEPKNNFIFQTYIIRTKRLEKLLSKFDESINFYESRN